MKGMKKIVCMMGLSILFVANGFACTGSSVKGADGTQLFGRTLEFGIDLKSNVIVIPRNFQFTAQGVENEPGLSWKGKYAAVGMNGQDLNIIVDGLNEKGLAVGTFYFPDFAAYQDVTAQESKQSLSSYELGVWLLTNFATVDEVKAALPTIKVSKAKYAPYNFTLPLHYIVNEASGKSMVIEYLNGELKTYDNPFGVITNAPSFDWQLTNLANYINLTPHDKSFADFGSYRAQQLGHGTGMLGLPGDFTPPSRFVRSVLFSTSMPQPKNAEEGVLALFHLLNNFDIPRGAIVAQDQGQSVLDTTQWTTVNDMTHHLFYFHTYNNPNIRSVNLDKLDLNAKQVKIIPIDSGNPAVQDISVL